MITLFNEDDMYLLDSARWAVAQAARLRKQPAHTHSSILPYRRTHFHVIFCSSVVCSVLDMIDLLADESSLTRTLLAWATQPSTL